MKKCSECKNILSVENFSKNRSKRDGLCDCCKSCKKTRDKAYQMRNASRIKSKKHEYYLSNKDIITRKVNDWIRNNQSKHREYSTVSKNKLKHEVFCYYVGGEPKCQHCSLQEIGILTIDHIDGNGGDHRRELFGKNNGAGGYNFYRWLKRNNYPEGFQVLCYKCQFKKRLVEMRPKNPTPLQLTRSRYVRSIKLECLDNYGGRICPCGEEDLDVLTLDHVNDDGSDHRRETGTKGFNFYMMLRKNGFPRVIPLQSLCINCQIRKRNKVYEEGKSRSTDDGDGATIAV